MYRFFGVVLTLLFLVGCSSKEPAPIRIAASANTQFAIKEICKAFESETGLATEVILGSSGKLSAQIKNGAPFDVFVSADVKNPGYLYQDGVVINEPEIYAKGRLVLWSMEITKDSLINTLIEGKLTKLATANPVTAPYGLAAQQVLTNLDLQKVYADKLVFGESIAQTNLFISSGSVPMGFSALSIVISSEMKGKGAFVELSPKLYEPIEQAAVRISEKPSTKQFYDFLFSESARRIFIEFGYFTP